MNQNLSEDKRRFPRIGFRSQDRVVYSTENGLTSQSVMSKNLSASGLCFQSSSAINIGNLLLVHLEQDAADDLKQNRATVMKTGNYLLGRVVWQRPLLVFDRPCYQTGCEFLARSNGSLETLDTLTRLMNFDTASRLS